MTRLLAALDLPTPEANLELAAKLSALPGPIRENIGVKVGLNTFIAAGPALVRELRDLEVCLDLKLFDIPNTMEQAATRIAELGVGLMTVHASAGIEGLAAVMKSLRKLERPPLVFAVTVLTSMTEGQCFSVYGGQSVEKTFESLVSQALHGGADGIVCSAAELPRVDGWVKLLTDRQMPPRVLKKLVPGIELAPRKDDQVRKGALWEVVWNGADYVVVGRPIYQADDPAGVVTKIVKRIADVEQLKDSLEIAKHWE